jgi:hypothetical protein
MAKLYVVAQLGERDGGLFGQLSDPSFDPERRAPILISISGRN